MKGRDFAETDIEELMYYEPSMIQSTIEQNKPVRVSDIRNVRVLG